MNRVRVKICGLTRPDDARLAAELGADALGFVFWPGSPRAVEPLEAVAICRDVPALVSRVGVFVNGSVADLLAVVGAGRIDTAQLHGDELATDYVGLCTSVIKAVKVETDADIAAALKVSEEATLLVDASDPVLRGGTGRTADWQRAAFLAARRPIILAGGLTAANVGDAIAAVSPWGVDVSSGVEASPGIKSPEKLRAFFGAVSAVNGAEA